MELPTRREQNDITALTAFSVSLLPLVGIRVVPSVVGPRMPSSAVTLSTSAHPPIDPKRNPGLQFGVAANLPAQTRVVKK